MIKAIQCNPHEHNFVHLTDIDKASEVIKDSSNLLWLDLENPTEED